MTKQQIASMIDHTLLKATATPEQIRELCATARELGTASVCVNPCHVALAAEELKGSPVKVCTVVGFPLGANTTAVKAFETRDAIANGADEVDMVINHRRAEKRQSGTAGKGHLRRGGSGQRHAGEGHHRVLLPDRRGKEAGLSKPASRLARTT